VTAYSPLGSYGSSVAEKKPLLLNDPVVQTIAKKHDKAATQVLLRWGIQRGTVVIPKSTTPDHIRANSQIFDFSLAAEDMLALGALNRGLRFVNPTDWWKMPFF
jgi:diketogulonate reductase-like aldo/keto reductase